MIKPGYLGEQLNAATNLQDLKLSDILPERLKTADILALVNALDIELQEITKAIEEIIIMPRISEQPEDIVDSLAWQLHVDFYEPLGLNLDKKRALVENSLIWHKHKGTKYALESLIRTLFFENFKIEEWFEYGGKPYFFRLISWDSLREKEQYNDLIRAIYELKNVRSWLEGLRFIRQNQGTIYFGQVGRHTRKFEIDETSPQVEVAPVIMHFGIAGKHVKRFEVNGTLPTRSKIEPMTAHIGVVGKHICRFIIPAGDIAVKIEDTEISTGLASRYISKTIIGSSEEVEN